MKWSIMIFGILMFGLMFINVVSASIFDVSIIPKEIEYIITSSSIKEQNPFCLQGFVQYCDRTDVQKKEVIYNRYVMEPFNRNIKQTYYGKGLDLEDIYTMKTYDLNNVESCSRNQTSILGIYTCVKSFVHEKHLNCRAAASAFKIALINSDYYKNLKIGERNRNESVEIYKAFFYDRGVISHRFLLLKNRNGYYVLDPQQCNSKSNEYCIFLHTKYFYDVPNAINYRGNVYKIERII
ncbi:hypothetical protein J7J26_03485 [Candidatus Micrarchaeota archaeon]|nr:hypothetical protein [Candidatus Micrarchaeota archaeon]